MSDDELRQTVKMQISRKVGKDSRGQAVWTKPIEPVELELVSTTMLQRILESNDEDEKRRIRVVADSNEGVLARNTSTNEFEILGDDELQAALDAAGSDTTFNRPDEVALELIDESKGDEEFSLVSTQALRKVLGKENENSGDVKSAKKDELGGFNPYDNS